MKKEVIINLNGAFIYAPKKDIKMSGKDISFIVKNGWFVSSDKTIEEAIRQLKSAQYKKYRSNFKK